MEKITYIFGAGASKGCLPIVAEFPNRLKEPIGLLEMEEYQLDNDHFELFIRLFLKTY